MEFNDDFVKIDRYYILGKAYSKSQLENFFTKNIVATIKSIFKPYDITNVEYNFIIGSCMPYDNILLDFKANGEYFPAKLDKLLQSNIQLKYLLKEHDIKIDIILFNEIFNSIFNKLFSSHSFHMKQFGKTFSNLIFIQHARLDCYSMFKTLKFLYGKNACTNVWKDCLQAKYSNIVPMISINELICKYMHNKHELNRSIQFKTIVKEVDCYLKQCIENTIS